MPTEDSVRSEEMLIRTVGLPMPMEVPHRRERLELASQMVEPQQLTEVLESRWVDQLRPSEPSEQVLEVHLLLELLV